MTAEGAPGVEEIWAEVGTSLQRFVRRRVSDPHEAEDVVAEVLLRIHQHLPDLSDRERVTAWVFRIARNTITDGYRRSGRRIETLTADVEPGAARGADAWLDDQEIVLADLASCIRPLVRALPRDYRRALELTDLEGRTQAEAARIEGVSLSGMKSRVQRGRRQFAALVRRCCEITTDSRGEPVDFRPRAVDCADDPAAAQLRAIISPVEDAARGFRTSEPQRGRQRPR
ncbi:MAG TPA: sigma-70 family RNA polymerase sigma factor [Acidimicrobiales bacterium]|nr:sigma-70 family RNA polymerase sigma factor [Acidimicrobiales bacterium]